MATLSMVQLHPASNVIGRVTNPGAPPPGIETGKPVPLVTIRGGHVEVVVVAGVVEVVVV